MCGGVCLIVWIEYLWMIENLKINLYVEFVFVCLILYFYWFIISEYFDIDLIF